MSTGEPDAAKRPVPSRVWSVGASASASGSGAANDLQQANSIARSAVQELGLSDATGKLVDSGGPMSEATRSVMDSETERLVAEAYRDAIALLEEHRAELDRLTDALLTAEDVDRAEILVALGPDLPQRTLRPNFGSGRPAVAATTRSRLSL